MKLTAFQYGKTEISEKMAFPGGNEQKKLPISLLFFLAETEGKKILIDVGCDTMPGFPLYEFRKPIQLLEEYGIGRQEITDVLLTHSHHDHIDAVRYYPEAEIWLQENEKKAADPYVKECRSVSFFREEHQVTKDIRMQWIGGHSFGSSIVLIRDTLVLCGDECYSKENLRKKIPTGTSVCPEKSLQFVLKYSRPPYRTLLMHDPDLVGEIGVRILMDEP